MPPRCLGIALLALGIGCEIATVQSDPQQSPDTASLQVRLLDKCCQIGKERAIESAKFNCKLGASEALLGGSATAAAAHRHNLFASSTESLLARDQNFADQCELVLESCCMAHHRTRNCNSGKQFAKSGSACMDVELSSEATVATESFNDCCMSCSLGILAARTPSQNETNSAISASGSSSSNNNNNNRLSRHWSSASFSQSAASSLANRCKLMQPLASSLSGQLYEQTYVECCQENLQRPLGALVEPGAPIDCNAANACAHRCVSGGPTNNGDRCECFSGYMLASDGFSCLDLDECKLNLHTCNRQTEICDNIRGSFRCLARGTSSRHLTQGVSSESSPEIESISSVGHFDEQPKFASMRLCPPNQSWNAIEQRCQPKSNIHHNSAHGSPPSYTSNSHYRLSHSAAAAAASASSSFASSSLRRRSVV